MTDINKVLLTGRINRLGLSWLSSGKPELRLGLTVAQDGGFILFVAVFCYGKDCERLAETLEVGLWVMVDGKLSWRSTTKDGIKESKMIVTTFGVEILTPPSEPVAARSEKEPSPSMSDEPANAPEPKARKPRYPKYRPDVANRN
jgi:single-stranded DNA-binding protein